MFASSHAPELTPLVNYINGSQKSKYQKKNLNFGEIKCLVSRNQVKIMTENVEDVLIHHMMGRLFKRATTSCEKGHRFKAFLSYDTSDYYKLTNLSGGALSGPSGDVSFS